MIDVNSFLSNNWASCEDASAYDFTSIIEGVKVCSRINNLSSIIVDYDKKEAIFTSEHLIYLDEAVISDYKRTCANPYWSLLDEKTMEQLSFIQKDYFKLRDVMSEEEYNKHICIVDYPISIRGRNFYINSRFSPLVVHPGGVIRLGLFVFSPSNKKELSCMVISPSRRRWSYDYAKRAFQEFDLGVKLSVTDKAILQRAKKGMSNEEIANDLFLSLNTIKSHKLHIFKKLGVTTITEALVVIGNYNLL